MTSEMEPGHVGTQSFLDVLRMAKEKTNAEQWTDVAALWVQVVAVNPTQGTWWAQLGYTYYHAQQYHQAITAFEKALELGGGFPALFDHEYSSGGHFGLP